MLVSTVNVNRHLSKISLKKESFCIGLLRTMLNYLSIMVGSINTWNNRFPVLLLSIEKQPLTHVPATHSL